MRPRKYSGEGTRISGIPPANSKSVTGRSKWVSRRIFLSRHRSGTYLCAYKKNSASRMLQLPGWGSPGTSIPSSGPRREVFALQKSRQRGIPDFWNPACERKTGNRILKMGFAEEFLLSRHRLGTYLCAYKRNFAIAMLQLSGWGSPGTELGRTVTGMVGTARTLK